MASGSFGGSTNNQYITPTISWSSVRNIEGNYSDVTATLRLSRTNSGYTTQGTWSGSISIDGQSSGASVYLTISYNSNTVAVSATKRIYHNDDGTKSVYITASGGISGTSYTSTSIGSTVTLDTIPRGSALSIPTFTIGSAGTIGITRYVDSFTDTITYKFGTLSGTLAELTSEDSITWTPGSDFYAQIASAASGTGTINVKTYNGDTLIQSKDYSFTVNVGSAIVPTITSVTVTPVNNVEWVAERGIYVKGFTQARVVTVASPGTGSTIESISISGGLGNGVGNDVTLPVIMQSGDFVETITATDARGRTATTQRTVTVINYDRPNVTTLSYSRGVYEDDVWTADENGAWVKIYASVNFSLAEHGNEATVSASVAGASAGTTTLDTAGSVTFYFEAGTDDTKTLSVSVTDSLGATAEKTTSINPISVPMNLNARIKGLAFGTIASKPKTVELYDDWTLDVEGNQEVKGTATYSGAATFNGSASFAGAVSMDTPLPLASGGLGASTASGGRDTLDADQRLKSASTWAEAVANAKSEIIVCMYTGSDVYSVTIPRAEITTSQKTFYQGGAYSSGSLNHIQISVTTTTITAGWYFNGSIRSQTYRLYYR